MREHAGRVDVVVTHWPPTLDALHLRRIANGRSNALIALAMVHTLNTVNKLDDEIPVCR